MLTNRHPTQQFGPTPLQEVTGNPFKYTIYLSRLRTAYKCLALGPFTDTVLAEIINTGTESILAAYKVEVEQEIEQAGIKSQRLQDILTKGYYEMLGELSNARTELIQAVEEKRQGIVSNTITN